jgi:hypothetical protein
MADPFTTGGPAREWDAGCTITIRFGPLRLGLTGESANGWSLCGGMKAAGLL